MSLPVAADSEVAVTIDSWSPTLDSAGFGEFTPGGANSGGIISVGKERTVSFSLSGTATSFASPTDEIIIGGLPDEAPADNGVGPANILLLKGVVVPTGVMSIVPSYIGGGRIQLALVYTDSTGVAALHLKQNALHAGAVTVSGALTYIVA